MTIACTRMREAEESLQHENMGRKRLSQQEQVTAILTRPSEPIFIPKGRDGVVFDVLDGEMLAERFNSIRDGIRRRFFTGDNIVALNRFDDSAAAIADISLCQQLNRHAKFSVFIPHHRRMARKLIEIFLGRKTFDDFISAAVYVRDRVSPSLFVYAFCIAVQHRPDAEKIHLPPFHEMFPNCFVDGKTLRRVKLFAQLLPGEKILIPEIPRDWTANDLDFEHRLAYFREDVGLSFHHWHWHLVYPFDCPEEILNKDRRGELFYHMHHQMIARYNSERFCNNLARVKRFFNFNDTIEEGYFPKIDKPLGTRSWASRPAGAKLSDIRREKEKFVFDLEDLKRWKDRIIEAIHLGKVVDEKGQTIQLDEKTGIDILGNIIEACPTLSKNYSLYGDLHNYGHLAISLCHDPDNRFLEEVSVMGVPATAARDPLFYRWHAFIDYIFEMHKNTLPPYSPHELDYQGIRIQDVMVKTDSSEQTLHTFMETVELDLSHGLDFTPNTENIHIKVTRLQHRPFTYTIKVENSTYHPRVGTVRIFLAPKYDETGHKMLLIDQKRLFIELDKFPVKLTSSPSTTTIKRKSIDSNVTARYESSFVKILNSYNGGNGTPEDVFCGCGWPQNLLIPKGKPEGFQCQLFVMISKYEDDMVEGLELTGECVEANTYCGARNKKYPDRRAMGYPFDRPAKQNFESLQEFVTPNMHVTDVKIVFSEERGKLCPTGETKSSATSGD